MARKRNSRSKRNADGEQRETPQAAAEEEQPQSTQAVTEEEQPKTTPVVPEEEQPKTIPAVTEEEQPQSTQAVTEEEQPKTSRAVTEEEQPKTSPVVTEEEQPKTTPVVTEVEQPKTTPVVTEVEQPKTASGLSASVESSADASDRPSEQEGGTSKETESVTASPRDARSAASQKEKTSLSCAGSPRAGSPAVRAAPVTSPQTGLLSPRGEPPSTRLSDYLLLSPTTEKAEGAHSSGVRTPTKPTTSTPDERVGDDLSVGRYSDVLGHHLPQTSFEATLPWTRTEYTCGLCAPSSTFILPTSTPIKADLTRYEGPDCKLITIRTRRYPAHQASFVDQVNIAQDRRSLWEMGKAVFSKEGFKFADARGVWNLVREVKRGCLEPGYYPVVEVHHGGRKVRKQRVPPAVDLYH
ncbi:putative glutamine/glutamic acid rich protein [Toxoplasma gondii GAB2-2007-GAL-DOM2]|uniref:Uncharacterized protein n=6 Tax=Toxoplasma gondii TaxID=5811 RepID=S7V3F8_TOXGG|nr:hypothetical protein TGGT1_231880 [Toxoplasma gondii GT1]KAF4641784.1 hypothetical protein TGRH88_075950 [Toxoplasma gondii]KFG48565.1 putative glutamine/glutamic acid rich protein [Toxoplasma gondii GAB2-2007-GAL-DOM2]KFG55363.1 putative glutamine/glutamic acid rich protein [Toxoplasma gondii FOU]PUA92704.1 putative glutamine/glutamic acid rich protein [Toxoplasma gondii TgCATBr9]RQX75840.1 putative glutamine/glutamic acid rich protein [Toxoplasma gondii CAST]